MEYLLARSDRQLGICLRMLYDEGYKGLVVESVINAKNRMEFHVKVMSDEATMAKLNERYQTESRMSYNNPPAPKQRNGDDRER